MFQKEDEGHGTGRPAKVPQSAQLGAGPPAEPEEQGRRRLDQPGWLRPAGPLLTHGRLSWGHRCSCLRPLKLVVVKEQLADTWFPFCTEATGSGKVSHLSQLTR